MIWTPNKVTLLRVAVGGLGVSLFGPCVWLNLLAVELTATALDALDGHLARKLRMATRLEKRNGCWTGRLDGEAAYGNAKARAAEALALSEGFDLRLCYAYGNDLGDRPLLEAIGHAQVVLPSRELAAWALTRQWTIERWKRERPRIWASAECQPVCEKIGVQR